MYGPATPPAAVASYARHLQRVPQPILYGDFLACDGFDVSASLGRIACPALIICGLLDRMTPPRDSEFLAAGLASTTLHLVENAGHMVMIEQPAAVIAAFSTFMAGFQPTSCGDTTGISHG
jgi:pimeloyl-ACP methyl ester carboxylesterase